MITASKLEAIFAEHGAHFDHVFKSKGTIKIRRGFSYRMGGSPEKLAEKVRQALSVSGMSEHFEIVSAEEHWPAWPKDRYWEVVLQERQG